MLVWVQQKCWTLSISCSVHLFASSLDTERLILMFFLFQALSPRPFTGILRVIYLPKKGTKHTVDKVKDRFDFSNFCQCYDDGLATIIVYWKSDILTSRNCLLMLKYCLLKFNWTLNLPFFNSCYYSVLTNIYTEILKTQKKHRGRDFGVLSGSYVPGVSYG